MCHLVDCGSRTAKGAKFSLMIEQVLSPLSKRIVCVVYEGHSLTHGSVYVNSIFSVGGYMAGDLECMYNSFTNMDELYTYMHLHTYTSLYVCLCEIFLFLW